jgi:hypothetical protein
MPLTRLKLKLDKLAEMLRLAKGLENASPAERRAIERKIDAAIDGLADVLQPSERPQGRTFTATQRQKI